MARKHKLSRKQRRIKHRVTLRTLFLLSITLIFNTYAWFLYATTVSTNLTAHVDAWKVEFEVNENQVEREINFPINHAYPGMQNASQTVSISNTGEKAADITYEMKMLRIFDDYFITAGYAQELGEEAPEGATVLTSAELLSKIQNDYPFHLNVSTGQNTLQVGQSSTLTMSFGWEYETGADETDTDYGTRAKTYYEENDGKPVIQIILKITVIQHKDS